MAENERKTWIMYKKAPPKYEYTPGFVANWRGIDAPVNGSWMDTTGKYWLKPTVPAEFVHTPKENCYYKTSFRSYMTSNFHPRDGEYTYEFVIKEPKSIIGAENNASGVWRHNAGFVSSFNQYNGVRIIKIYVGNKEVLSPQWSDSGGHLYGVGTDYPIDDFEQVATISYSYKDIFMDGTKAWNYGSSSNARVYHNDTLVVGSWSSQIDRAVKNMKVCAIRWYPFVLTAEQRMNNHLADKIVYDI